MPLTPTGVQMAKGDVLQVIVYTHLGEQAGLNILHYVVNNTTVDGANDMSRVMDFFDAQALPFVYQTLMVSAAHYDGTSIRKLTPDQSVEYLFNFKAGFGDVTGDPLPGQMCGLIKKRSAVPGKRRGGRLYVQFPGEIDNDVTTVPIEDYISRLGDLRAALSAPVTWGADGLANLIIYRPAKTTAPVHAARITNIRDLIEEKTWATQRRRSLRGRPNLNPFG